MKKKIFTKRRISAFLTTVVTTTAVLLMWSMTDRIAKASDFTGTTQAEAVHTAARTINLNTQQSDGSYKIEGITDPTPAPEDWDLSEYAWEGSKVYFGSYGGNPLLFRVLDADTILYNPGHTMLLDCDTLLEKMKFYPRDYWNDWDGSDLKEWMNSNEQGGFTNCDNVEVPGMLYTFTTEEQNAIALSTKETEEGTDGYGWPLYLGWCPLLDDKVFALDAMEASYPPFGYNSTNSQADNRIKSDTKGDCWWLRSRDFEGVDDYCVGVIDWDGRIRHIHVACSVCWACPAMNLNLSSILFASVNGTDKTSDLVEVGTNDKDANIWKLTLLDTGKMVGITEGKLVTKKEQNVMVPYTYAGTNVSQISVMITDKEYDSMDATVLYYGRLDTKASFSSTGGNGKGTFTLPDGLPDTAKIYLLAEDVNAANYTDYASAPILIDKIEDAALLDIGTTTFVGLFVPITCIGIGTSVIIIRKKRCSHVSKNPE